MLARYDAHMRQQRAKTRILQAALAGVATSVLAVSLAACAGAVPGEGSGETGERDGESGMGVEQEILGTWVSDEPGKPRLAFAEDGTVKGTDGCNGISTTYEVEGETVVLEQFASTLKACKGVDDWLRGVHEVRVDGDTLLVSNSSGEEIGQLQRDDA